MPDQAEWIAVDWGTSNVRAWAMTNGNPVAEARSDKGMGRLAPTDYPRVLDELVAALDVALPVPCPVIACGMVGARQGWAEAAYLELPADLHQLGANATRPDTTGEVFDVHILSGVCQRGEAEDVMRGEETQILGLLALEPGFSGLVCLPGTHSKWAQIADGRMTAFSTAMTGELFELLSRHSVLRHSIEEQEDEAVHQGGFAAGLAAGRQAPEQLTSLLFRTRAASLLSHKGPDWCAGYLSGVLVGAEVAGFRTARGDRPVMLIGSEKLCDRYAAAIAGDGGTADTIDASRATLAGLGAARRQILQ